MDVTAITVAYRSADQVPLMAATLPAGVPLVVVDNSAEPALINWTKGQGVRLIVLDENLGFGRACNLGAEAAQSGFLLFLNPDARLHPGCLQALLDAAARAPDAVAFGPKLLGENGRWLYKRVSAIAPKDRFAPVHPPNQNTTMPVLEGSVLLVRRAAFMAIGGFDPNIFLYFEDDDLSLRLRANGGTLRMVPDAVASHAAGKSSAPSAALSRLRSYHYMRSYIYALRKHGMPLPLLIGWTHALSYLIFLRRHRTAPEPWAQAKGRIAGAWSMLWKR